MRNTVPVGISLPHSLLEKIDKQRGMIPRSTYIQDLLIRALRARTEETKEFRKAN